MENLAEVSGVEQIQLQDDGSYVVTPTTGAAFTVSVSTGVTTDSAVAQSTVDTDARTVQVTLSDHANRRSVSRALAHEIAEASYLLSDPSTPPSTTDVLTATPQPDGVIDPVSLTAHDRGRIAELRVLSERLSSTNPIRSWQAHRDLLALIDHLGLVTTTEVGQTPTRQLAQRRIAVLPADLQPTVRWVSAMAGLDGTPSAVPSLRLHLLKGLLTGATTTTLTASALAAFGALSANPGRISAAVVAISAATGGAIVGSMAEHRFARASEGRESAVDAATPIPPEVRHVQELHAQELRSWAEETRQRAAAQEQQSTLTASAPTTTSQSTSGRLAHDSTADRQAMHQADVDTNADAGPTEQDKVPTLPTFFARMVSAPLAALGIGFAANVAVGGLTTLPSAAFTVGILGAAAASSFVTTFAERSFARSRAARADVRNDVIEARAVASSQARIDAQTATLRTEQAALRDQQTAQQDLDTWLAQAREALIASATTPDALSSVPTRPAVPAPSTDRVAERAARAATLDVPSQQDSALQPDGRLIAAPRRVAARAAEVISNLGVRDGLTGTPTVHPDGSLELQYSDGSTHRVRIDVRPAADFGPDTLARTRTDADGTITVELSARTSLQVVPRATLFALNQVLANDLGAPVTAHQLTSGPTTGPIDPTALTALDHARLADLTHLLDAMDHARPREQRRLTAHYDAALRAAGLDAPMSTDSDPDTLGWPRRRALLDPALADRVAMRDPLPSTVPSFWVHQRKTLVGMGVPAIATGALLLTAGPVGAVTAAGMLGTVALPILASSIVALGERALNRSNEARTDRALAGDLAASPHVLAQERALAQTVQERRDDLRARVEHRQAALSAQVAQYDADLARAQRGAVQARQNPLSRLASWLTRRADTVPPSYTGTAPNPTVTTSLELDQTAQPELDAIYPHQGVFAARYAVGPITSAIGAGTIADQVTGRPIWQILNPFSWSQTAADQQAITAAAISSTVAVAATVPSILGERMLSRTAAELELARVEAQGQVSEQAQQALHDSRMLAPRQELQSAQAVLSRADQQASAQQSDYRSRITQAIPLRRRGPLNALGALLHGDRNTNGTDQGSPQNGNGNGDQSASQPDSSLTPALDAAERAAGNAGARVIRSGDQIIAQIGSTSVTVRFERGSVAAGSTIGVSVAPDGARVVTISDTADVQATAREVARGVTGVVMVARGVPRTTPTMSTGPLAPRFTAADLTVADYQTIAVIQELLHQSASDRSPQLSATLQEVLEHAGLDRQNPDSARRRAALPAVTSAALDSHDAGALQQADRPRWSFPRSLIHYSDADFPEEEEWPEIPRLKPADVPDIGSGTPPADQPGNDTTPDNDQPTQEPQDQAPADLTPEQSPADRPPHADPPTDSGDASPTTPPSPTPQERCVALEREVSALLEQARLESRYLEALADKALELARLYQDLGLPRERVLSLIALAAEALAAVFAVTMSPPGAPVQVTLGGPAILVGGVHPGATTRTWALGVLFALATGRADLLAVFGAVQLDLLDGYGDERPQLLCRALHELVFPPQGRPDLHKVDVLLQSALVADDVQSPESRRDRELIVDLRSALRQLPTPGPSYDDALRLTIADLVLTTDALANPTVVGERSE